jgi:hypothetical protein
MISILVFPGDDHLRNQKVLFIVAENAVRFYDMFAYLDVQVGDNRALVHY